MKKEYIQPQKRKSIESDSNGSLCDSEKQHQISTTHSIPFINPEQESCFYDTTAGSNLMEEPPSSCFEAHVFMFFKKIQNEMRHV